MTWTLFTQFELADQHPQAGRTSASPCFVPAIDISHPCALAVNGPGRPSARVRVQDGSDRALEWIKKLRFPNGDAGIGIGDVDEGKKTRQLQGVFGGALWLRDFQGDLVV